jgi:hypothetical protein
MKDPKKLAQFLTNNIMIYHDKKEYDELEKNSIKLVEEMGYSKIIAKKIALNIKKIYINYDLAQLEYEKMNFIKEIKYYDKSKILAQEINKTLNDKNDCVILIDIVIQWRHKNKIGSLLKIFKYWYKNLSFFNAIKATILQIKAGKQHDLRNKKLFEENFYKIYLLLLENKSLPILF